jgi:hypothetical protein
VAGAVVSLVAGELDELVVFDDADGEVDDEPDEEQPATAARTISAAAAPGFPLPERLRIGNTPVPPVWGAPVCAIGHSMTVGRACRL